MITKVTERQFQKMLKKYTPQKIIYQHISRKVTLSTSQINKIISLRDKKIKRINGGENER